MFQIDQSHIPTAELNCVCSRILYPHRAGICRKGFYLLVQTHLLTGAAGFFSASGSEGFNRSRWHGLSSPARTGSAGSASCSVGLPDPTNTSPSSARTGCQPCCWKQRMMVLRAGSDLHRSCLLICVVDVHARLGWTDPEIALMHPHVLFPLTCPGHSLHPPLLQWYHWC